MKSLKTKPALSGFALEHSILMAEYKRCLKLFHSFLILKEKAHQELKTFYIKHPEFKPKTDQTDFITTLFGG